MRYTRKQYIDKECTHREYYSQFVGSFERDLVQDYIGLTLLIRVTDLNDIPLRIWDNIGLIAERKDNSMVSRIRRHMIQLGDTLSLSGMVCIYKESARQLIDGGAG